MSDRYNPSSWTDSVGGVGGTKPKTLDFQNIAYDIKTAGSNRDLGGNASVNGFAQLAIQDKGCQLNPAGQRVAGQVFNILAYGAKVDGVADDKAAIQAAINAAHFVGGGTVYLPWGDAAISTGGLTIPGNNITIRGTQGASRLVFYDTTSADLITFATGVGNCTLVDFDIIGSLSKSSGYTIVWNTVNTCKLRGMNIDNCPFGLSVNAAAECLVADLAFFNLCPGTGIGVQLQGEIDDLYFYRVVTSTSLAMYAAGFKVIECAYVAMHSVSTLLADIGLWIVPGPGQVQASIEAIECHFDNCGRFGILNSPIGGASVRNRFIACWSCSTRTTGGIGVVMDSSFTGSTVADQLFVGHYSKFNQGYGFYILGPNTKKWQLVGCVITDNNKELGGAPSGVEIGANVNSGLIEGCTIGTDEVSTLTQSFGIFITGGTSDYLKIIGNDLTGNTSAGLVNGATGTHNYIVNNPGYNPVGPSAITVGASPFTYTAGASPEEVYINSGTVSDIKRGSTTVASASPGRITLPPNGSLTVTYSAAPTMVKDIQ